MTPQEIRRASSRERTKQWHEQRTAAGRCHGCPKRLTAGEYGWYCRHCRVKMAEQRAFAVTVKLLAEGKCVDCRHVHADRRWYCRTCRRALHFRCELIRGRVES